MSIAEVNYVLLLMLPESPTQWATLLDHLAEFGYVVTP